MMKGIPVAGCYPRKGAFKEFVLNDIQAIVEDTKSWRAYTLAKGYWWPWSEEWPLCHDDSPKP